MERKGFLRSFVRRVIPDDGDSLTGEIEYALPLVLKGGGRVLEEDARQTKRGLWADPNPVPLWEVRQHEQRRIPLVRGDFSLEPMENPDTTPRPTAPMNRMILTVKPKQKQQGFTEQEYVP